ncbi:ATP-binding region ATPase domain protein [Haliscomenobacter hydrossis DSM 1100]|uniref:histidine kinase n=2 Tax=Haliscomenobacter TaxID=2349 RepID=F4KP86_HALH1|nr:ATP-binding region ATPase domain protein [Haliscomenobacter hydrossis DSM 1100]
MQKFTLILVFTLVWRFGFAQIGLIDSLKEQLALARLDTSRVNTLRELSVTYWGVNPDSSLKYGQQSLALSQKIHYPFGETKAFHALGVLYRRLGDYPKSLEANFKGLQIAEKKQLPEPTISCLNAIAIVYKELKNYSKGINYYKRGLKIATATQHQYWMTQIELNLASTYLKTHQIDSASLYLQKVSLKLDLVKGPLIIKFYPLTLGKLQFLKGDYADAFKNVRKSILISQESNDHGFQSNGYIALSTFFKTQNQVDSSIINAKKGLREATLVDYKSEMLEASTLLAELYEPLDVKKALYYQKTVNAVVNELYGADRVIGLQNTLSEEQQRQSNMATQIATQQNRQKQYVLLGGLGIMFFIGFVLYRNYQIEKKAKTSFQTQKETVENTLSQLQSTQAQLIQSEKLASLGELTAGIAHEIQNPLNFVNNFSELNTELIEELEVEIKKGNLDDAIAIATDLKGNEEKINHHGQRAASIVKGMLEHSRASTGVKEPTDINALADEYLRMAYHGLRAKDNGFNATLVTHFDPDLPLVSVIPQDIGRVLLNLINNAFYAVAERSRSTVQQRASVGVTSSHADTMYQPIITISTQKIDNHILIKVKDDGNGIPESIREKIFQPFFTTKPTGQGTGLGLSLAYDIVTKGHGGSLEVESKEEHKTIFTMKIPI